MLRSVFTDSVKRVAGAIATETFTGLPVPNKYSMLTAQPLIVSGFSSVRNSVKPAPTLPSAKYHVLLTGPLVVGDGVLVGEGDGHGVGITVGDGVGDGVGEGSGKTDGLGDTVGFFEGLTTKDDVDDVGEGNRVGDGVGIGEGVGHGAGVLVTEGVGVTVLVLVTEGVGVAGGVPAGISSSLWGSLLTQTLLLPSTINPSNAPATVAIILTWPLLGFTKPTLPVFDSSNQTMPVLSIPIPATNVLEPHVVGVAVEPGVGHRAESTEKVWNFFVAGVYSPTASACPSLYHTFPD